MVVKKIKAAKESIKTGLRETKQRKEKFDKWEAAGSPGKDKK